MSVWFCSGDGQIYPDYNDRWWSKLQLYEKRFIVLYPKLFSATKEVNNDHNNLSGVTYKTAAVQLYIYQHRKVNAMLAHCKIRIIEVGGGRKAKTV